MPTSTKPVAVPPARPRVKPPVATKSASKKPFLRFYYPESLCAKTRGVLTTIERAEDATQYRNSLASIVVELTDSGMDYYFLRPLKFAKVGFLAEQSASLGMAATTSLMAPVIRNMISRMDQPQLLAVCGYIRQLMK